MSGEFDWEWGGECLNKVIGHECCEGECFWLDPDGTLWLIELDAGGVAYTFSFSQ